MNTNCTHCGHQSPLDAAYCEACGKPIIAIHVQSKGFLKPYSFKPTSRIAWIVSSIFTICVAGVLYFFSDQISSHLVTKALSLSGLHNAAKPALYYVGGPSGWGYINREGAAVIPLDYEPPPNEYSNRTLIVRRTAPYPVFTEKGWLLLNDRGDRISNLALESIVPVVSRYQQDTNFICGKSNSQWVCINKSGVNILPPSTESIIQGKNGMIAFRLNERWGFVDEKGTIKIKPIYHETGGFFDGKGLVRFDDSQIGLIDETGTEITKRWSHDGPLIPATPYIFSKSGGSRWGVSDTSGRLLFNLPEGYLPVGVHDSRISIYFGGFAESVAWIFTPSPENSRVMTYALVDASGKVIFSRPSTFIPTSFEFINGYALIRPSSTFKASIGAIGLDGKIPLLPFFDYMSPFDDGFAIVQREGTFWAIDPTGRALWPEGKAALATAATDVEDLISWRWRVKNAGRAKEMIDAAIEFGRKAVRFEPRSGMSNAGAIRFPYVQESSDTLRLTGPKEEWRWRWTIYGDELLIEGLDDGSFLLLRKDGRLERSETLSPSREKASSSKGNGIFKGGNRGTETGEALENKSSMEACKTLVRALIEGDRDLITRINRSSDFEWPTSHLMKSVAPQFQDTDPEGIEFRQVDERTVLVEFSQANPRGPERWVFKFSREKGGYFFVDLD